MSDSDTFVINAGSDLALTFAWPSGAPGVPADLTGYTIAPVDVHPALAGLISASIVTPTSGAIALALTWSDAIPRGRSSHFRLRLIAADGKRTTTNLLWVEAR
jgi:hypothetical protein